MNLYPDIGGSLYGHEILLDADYTLCTQSYHSPSNFYTVKRDGSEPVTVSQHFNQSWNWAFIFFLLISQGTSLGLLSWIVAESQLW